MTMRCTVCASEHLKQVDRKIVAGVPLSRIGQEFNLSPDALARHRDRHLAAQLRSAATRTLKNHTHDLLADMQDLMATSKEILESAMADNHRGLSLKAIKEVRNNVETLGKILFSMNQQATTVHDSYEIEKLVRDKEHNNRLVVSMQETLSPLELAVHRELTLKIISENKGWKKIYGIDYSLEKEDPETA